MVSRKSGEMSAYSRGSQQQQLSPNPHTQDPVFNISGVLWVKFPAGIRGNSWKVWDRKFTSIKSELILQPDSVSTCALLLINRSDKSDSEIIFKKRLTSQNTIIFRSKSRTQAHSFTVCVDDEPVIHLSSLSETDSQAWISCLRNILWPPTSFTQLERTLGCHFDVSIIDNEFSFHAGLLGMYGNLQITTQKAVLSHPHTNETVQEWLLSTVGFKILPQFHPQDNEKVVAMITDVSSATGYGTIIMFCPDGQGLIRRVHSVRKMFVQKSYGDQMKEEMSDVENGSLAQSYSIYSVPVTSRERLSPSQEEAPSFEFRKTLADPWLDKIVSDTIEDGKQRITGAEISAVMKARLWKNVANISEIILDSSVNFKSGIRSPAGENSHSTPGQSHILRESQSIEEEDDSYYRSLHEQIASDDCSPSHHDTATQS